MKIGAVFGQKRPCSRLDSGSKRKTHAPPFRVQQRHVVRGKAEACVHQCHGQCRLARARVSAKEHDAFVSEKRCRVDGKFIGAMLENLGEQLPFQHDGKFVGRA